MGKGYIEPRITEKYRVKFGIVLRITLAKTVLGYEPRKRFGPTRHLAGRTSGRGQRVEQLVQSSGKRFNCMKNGHSRNSRNAMAAPMGPTMVNSPM